MLPLMIPKRILAGLLLATSCACSSSQSRPAAPPASTVYAQPYPQGQHGAPAPGQPQGQPQQYGYPQAPPQYGPAQQPPPQGPPVNPTLPQPPNLAPAAPDAVAHGSVPGLRQIAQDALAELVAALPADRGARVANIPLVIDDRVGEVNAFATCRSGRSAMAITDGLLQILGILSQSQAHDELTGSQKVNEYISFLSSNLTPGKPIPAPPVGFLPAAMDGRIIARQRQVFEEATAFVLGHELAHHYLGHLGCTAGSDPFGLGTAARVLSDQVPLFNQPNEAAADVEGTINVLDAGRARGGRGLYSWTEGGGLLSMRFFAGFGQLSPASILLGFERSHPPPQLRTPLIQQAAANWRSTGGNPWRLPGF